jgi:hypothetical protein
MFTSQRGTFSQHLTFFFRTRQSLFDYGNGRSEVAPAMPFLAILENLVYRMTASGYQFSIK